MTEETNPGEVEQFNSCSRRRVLWNVLSGSMALATLSGLKPDKETASAESTLPRHITPEADAAISQGLAWLAVQQRTDGGFGRPRTYARNVGICALCGLAFLPQGILGPFQGPIEGCTNYLLSRAQPNGYIVEEHVLTHAPMYGHGFATTYLAQVYGMDLRGEVGRVLKRAVELILALQDASGAWRYTPFPEDADVSVTTCQMLALCAARQAGISIPRKAISRGVEFLKRCQNPDGGFRYRLADPPESLYPRSAAAVVTLHAAGLHHDPALEQGRQYLANPHAPIPQATGLGAAEYYFYGRYYGTHAAWQQGGEAWDRWFPTVREELLERQTSDGNWYDPTVGSEYATAMALLTLQFPFDTLPLYLI